MCYNEIRITYKAFRRINEENIFSSKVVLVIDSISYINYYNKLMQTYDEMLKQGYELEKPGHIDVFTKLEDYYQNGSFVIIQFIYPLLLIILGTLIFHKKIHSGFFKNVITRQNFKKYLKIEYFNACKASLLIPILILITFVFSCFVTNFNFDLTSLDYGGVILNQSMTRSLFSEVKLMIMMMFNLFIVSLACINIGLVFVKNNKNFIISSILSYLVIIIYQIVVEIIIGPILSDIFNSNFFANGLTLFSFWYYDSGVTPLLMFLYAMLLFVFSFLLVKNTYKDKEDVIIYAEK